MNERWRRLEELLDRALDLDDAGRSTFLAELAATEPELAAELGRMLAATGEDSLLDRPPPSVPPAEAGECVGPWRLLRRIGEGGMGAVFLAERADGAYERRAALKLLRSQHHPALRGFLLERRVLARLEHPGIARLLDAGVDGEGRHYLVMEWIDGEDLRAFCRRRPAELGRRLQLFLEVCEAVAHAHRNLVVHRDLKPGNVMVDAAGRARLLDFGVAKLLEVGSEDSRTLGALTPEYAAPEQLRGESITTRTDVYGLGALLFYLLTDHAPYPPGERSLAELVHDICNAPPPRPSEWARALGAAAPFPPERLRGDLDAIVARAMAKPPEWRYPSVEALADDVRRHLARRPVRARRLTVGYRLRCFLRRHAARLAVALTLALLLLSAALGWLAERRQAQEARQSAVSEAERTQSLLDLLQLVLRDEGVQGAPPLLRARDDIARIYADRPVERARFLLALAAFHLLRSEFAEALAIAEDLADEAAGLPPILVAEIHCTAAQAAVRLGALDRSAAHQAAAAPLLAELPEEAASRIRADCLLSESIRLRLAGRAADAVAAAREALALRARFEGEGGLHVNLIRANLGTTLMQLGRLAEAEAELERALTGLARLGQDRGTHALIIRNNLAAGRMLKGEVRQAERYFAELVALQRERAGSTPALAAALNNRGRCLLLLGRIDEAAALTEEALGIAISQLGEDNHEVAQHRLQLAEIALERGALEDAGRELDRATAVLAARLPAEHPARVRAELLRLRLAAGRGEPDAPARLLAFAEAHADANQPQRVSSSASALLELAALTRDAATASVHARRAYDLLRAGRGEGHWETARAALELARLLAARDRAAAKSLLESALPTLESQLGPEHPWSAAARALLAGLSRDGAAPGSDDRAAAGPRAR